MARRRSLSSQLFRAARITDDIEAAESGNPRRIARRAKNVAVGRALGKGRRVAPAVAMMALRTIAKDGVIAQRVLVVIGQPACRRRRRSGSNGLRGKGGPSSEAEIIRPR
jgi:hypothetical protein